MKKYTRAEFVVLLIMLFLNILLIVIIIGFGNLSGLAIFENNKINSPSDFIKDSDIEFKDNQIIININDPILARFTDTDSMIPVLDSNSLGIGFIPASPDEINLGDIISFRQSDKLIVHRVIEKGTDENGVYFITKGDNSNINDGKIRFSEINSVLVGILY